MLQVVLYPSVKITRIRPYDLNIVVYYLADRAVVPKVHEKMFAWQAQQR